MAADVNDDMAERHRIALMFKFPKRKNTIELR